MCDERKPGDVSELYRSSGISLLSELSVAVIGIEWGLLHCTPHSVRGAEAAAEVLNTVCIKLVIIRKGV